MNHSSDDKHTDETLSFQLPSQLSPLRHQPSLLGGLGFWARSLTDIIKSKRFALAALMTLTAAISGSWYRTRYLPVSSSSAQPVEARLSTAAAQSVTLHTAKVATVKTSFQLTGTVVAKNLLRVAPSIEGLQILELWAEPGDRVTQGQVLAVLDDRALQAQLRQAKAALDQAQSDVNRQEAVLIQAQAQQQAAMVDTQRYERLYQEGATSQSQLDERQMQAITARESVAVSQATLLSAQASTVSQLAEIERVETLLAQTVMTAPTTGIIAEKQTTVGDTAAVSQPVYSLIESGQLMLQLLPSQAQLQQLNVGTPVTISTVEASTDLNLQSSIASIDPILDAQSRQATVKIELPPASSSEKSSQGNLRPGMSLKADIITDQRRSVVVPAAAVMAQPNGTSVVFTVSDRSQEENRVQANVVEVGSGQVPSNNLVEILSGLEAGSRVVVGGASYLQSGDRVTVVSSLNP